MLSTQQVNEFNNLGYTIIDSIITSHTVNEIRSIIDNLALLVSDKNITKDNTISTSPYLNLVKKNRTDAGKVFDTLIKIPLVNQICYSDVLQKIAEQLLSSNLVLASPSQMNLRSDHPEEDKFLYPWHTDYFYNFSSTNSLVFWIPLDDVDNINGCLHIIPTSHKLNAKVEFSKSAWANKQSGNYFKITNIKDLIQINGEVRCPLKLGQAIVFHSKLIHKSGINLSTKTRYAIQSRWFDATSKDAILNRFTGGIDEGKDPNEYLNLNLPTMHSL
jgi:phytanoyl-CoA hydroxylase